MLTILFALLLAGPSAFPPLEARDLAGHARSAADLKGAPAALVLAIGRGSSSSMRPWQEFIREATDGKLRVVECPVFYGSNAWMRPMVEAVMARRRPKDTWANVWTTADGDKLAQSLGLASSDGDVAVVLLDAQGRVAEIIRGALSDRTRKAVREGLEKLVPAPGA